MMKSIKTIIAVLGLTCATQAGAVTITFNDADGALSSQVYTTQGYVLTPVNLQSGQCDTAPCAIEQGQTGLPSMVRADQQAFDLVSFWISPTGNGQISGNFISVQAFTGTPENYVAVAGSLIEFAVNSLLSSYSAVASVVYDDGASDPGNAAAFAACQLVFCKNYGYRVTLLPSLFEDITKIQWSAYDSAQARLDSIVTNDPSPVPIPAAGFMLIGALGGLGALRRRRKAA